MSLPRVTEMAAVPPETGVLLENVDAKGSGGLHCAKEHRSFNKTDLNGVFAQPCRVGPGSFTPSPSQIRT